MSLHPSVRIVEELSGDTILECPGFFSLPRLDELISLSEDGGAATKYKVEKVEYVLNKANHPGPSPKFSVNGMVEITLSLVP